MSGDIRWVLGRGYLWSVMIPLLEGQHKPVKELSFKSQLGCFGAV